MKKIAFSVLATSALAVLIAAPGEAEAASDTYAVKPGDTLWKIASKHQISIAQLKSLNNLAADIIYPGQRLMIALPDSGKRAEASETAGITEDKQPSASPSAVYTVKSGDSLSKIANIHKTTVAKLKQLNGLSGDLILVGQKLKVTGTAVQQSTSSALRPESKPAQNTATSASSGTYTVKSGDTLSAISHRHGISIDQLMKANGLTSHIIYVGQKLKVNGSSTATKPGNTGAIIQASKPNTKLVSQIYSVQSGDTLSAIGWKFGVTVTDLTAWNKLLGHTIQVGQKLRVKGSSVTAGKPSQTTSPIASASSPIEAALSVLGTPYAWAGTSPAGFDCSGFIWYAFKTAGADLARTNTDGYFNRSFYVDTPQPGDLVFFKGTYKRGISHMGIYLGSGKFVHASTSQGVVVSHVNDAYWKDKFDSFKRFY